MGKWLPFSVEFQVTLAAPDQEEAVRFVDDLTDEMEDEWGAHVEVAFVEQMRPSEVVPDSPLAEDLRNREAKP